MSGPIVRKYGFPNFDKIFGAKPVLHGVEDDPKAEAPREPEPGSADAKQGETPGESPAEAPRTSS